MKDRDQKLIAKRTSLADGLRRWANKEEILEAGEQLEFTLVIKPSSAVVDASSGDVLARSISSVFTPTYCHSLGIKKSHVSRLRRLRDGTKVSFGGGYATQEVTINTIGDIMRIPRRSFRVRQLGEECLDAIQKVLASLGLTWE